MLKMRIAAQIFFLAIALMASNVQANVLDEWFYNSDGIQVTDGEGASPYPSEISISSFPQGSEISMVRVKLMGLRSDAVDDLDVLLVGPDGQTGVMLMSDVTWEMPQSVWDVDIWLDSSASSPLPADDSLTNSMGWMQPTDYDPGDTDDFPAPAPFGFWGTDLDIFNLSDPNGTWSLFISDDLVNGSYSMQFSAWHLNIVAETPDDGTGGSQGGGQAPVPEPGSMLLLITGLLVIMGLRQVRCFSK